MINVFILGKPNHLKWNFTLFSKTANCISIETEQPLYELQVTKGHLFFSLLFNLKPLNKALCDEFKTQQVHFSLNPLIFRYVFPEQKDNDYQFSFTCSDIHKAVQTI